MSSVPVPHAGSTTHSAPNSFVLLQSTRSHLSGDKASPARRVEAGIVV